MTSAPANWFIGIALAVIAVLSVIGLVSWLRRRRSFDYLLKRMAWERLEDVVIPDEVDGEIHLDLALLTPRGILLLEVRRASGTLFWGANLDRWTVLDGARRKVLDNPLPGLRARRHAVRALAPQVPVDGRVLLVGPVEISGAAPPGVVLQADLVAEFPARGKQSPPPELRAAWAALKAAARPL
ncbi:MAG: nuclease-related domain-containing protein [Gammaproteobacteria bacterium]